MLYFHIALEETNFRQMDNPAGFGWSGGTWPTILKALRLQGLIFHGGWWEWSEKHPYEVNRALASYFSIKVSERNISFWHSSNDPQNNENYTKDVLCIAKYCARNK